MELTLVEEPIVAVGELARIPIAFEVDRVFDVQDLEGVGRYALSERALDQPFLKDYDAVPGNSPLDWTKAFDLTNWGMIGAYAGDERVGAAVVARDTSGISMLENRDHLAVLWDLRVAPGMRRKGIGSALFRAAEEWAAARGCIQLKVETQNINVAACRFYRMHGCRLGGIDRAAYPALPDEIQLLWYKDLG